MTHCADIANHINEIEAYTVISREQEEIIEENIEVSQEVLKDDIPTQENVVTVITEEPISDNVTEMTLIANQVSIDTITQSDILLKCEKCDFTFKSPFYMHQHFEQVHGVSPILSEANQCFLCSAPFTRFCPFS